LIGEAVNVKISEGVYLLFKRHDKDRDGRLSYTEFCSMILPKDRNIQLKIQSRQSVSRSISYESKVKLAQLVSTHLNVEQGHEYLRARVKNQQADYSVSINEIFRLLDSDNKSYLSVYDLEDLLFSQSKTRKPDLMGDVELLLSKYDRTGDRRISYLEFVGELTPKHQ